MRVIIINGPMGAGKTTVGKIIAEKHPGTAFIDGDWCMDLHPFVGDEETRAIAVDNILHMIRNYQKCSSCAMIVLAWLIDEPWVMQRLTGGLFNLGLEIKNVTLICNEEELTRRWKNDRDCEWRTDRWLDVSLKSLTGFRSMSHTIDTGDLTADQVADVIMQ